VKIFFQTRFWIKLIFVFALFFLRPTFVCSQSHYNRFFSQHDEIFLEVLPGNDIIYSHPFNDNGITIYNLASTFALTAQEILTSNKIIEKSMLNKGKIVKIPFKKSLLVIDNPNKFKTNKKVGIYYRSKKGDTLFKIANDYFGIAVDALIKMNQKSNNNIIVGEKILLGYLRDTHMPSITEKETKAIPENSPKQQHPNAIEGYTKNQNNVKTIASDILAFQDKSQADIKGHFVLSNAAKSGTTIDIYSPMLKRQTKAKVIGKIPSSTYHEDVVLIVSPDVARDLGVLDARFQVSIKYESN
jgi:LysM repeat protein